ncbi:MAG: helix-turn-helix transcriptional regulator [Actinomycetota bacterium]|nr:helix-turn-helix transcriptional regulator [Actinomycetota bacterium]MDP3630182.1 helix-turn-helix transcriptional regulator [Actinomycetota bacterium]
MEKPLLDPYCVDFGRRLRCLRQERGLSQEQLAHIAQLDRTYVSSCEAGRRNATIRTIARLAKALEVDPAALVSDRC